MSCLRSVRDGAVVRRAAGCGLVSWDVVIGSRQTIEYAGIGGTVGNVLCILAFLGWDCSPLVRIGQDSAGKLVFGELQGLGVRTEHLTLASDVLTPVVYQTLGSVVGAHVFSFRCPVCGQLRHFTANHANGMDAAVSQRLEQVDVFFFDRPSVQAVEFAERARTRGALVFFEPSGFGEDAALFARALQSAQVVKYSTDRLSSDELAPCEGQFLEIQTLGSQGLRYRQRSRSAAWEALEAIPSSRALDTAGAGDWCSAGLLWALGKQPAARLRALLEESNFVRLALRFGQALAALNCEYVGARGLMRAPGSSHFQRWLQELPGDCLGTFANMTGADVLRGIVSNQESELLTTSRQLTSVQSMPTALCCSALGATSSSLGLDR